MVDSLMLGSIDLLNPPGNGAAYVRLSREYDFGAQEPVVEQVVSQFVDGALQSGTRSGNRTIGLSLLVLGGTRAGRRELVAEVAAIVNSETFTVTYTPDDGLPMQWDCYRGSARLEKGLTIASRGNTQQPADRVDVEFQALPFTRSPDLNTIAAGAQAELSLFTFDTAATGRTVNTTAKAEGTGSNNVILTNPGTPVSTAVNFTAKNLTTYNGVRALVRWTRAGSSLRSLTVRVTIAGMTASKNVTFRGAYNSTTFMTVELPFDFSAATSVTAATVTLLSTDFAATDVASQRTVQIDDLRALPASRAVTTTPRGALYSLFGVKGNARTPMALEITNAALMTSLLVHRPTGRNVEAPILQAVPAPSSGTSTVGVAAPAPYAGTFVPTFLIASATVAPGQNLTVTLVVEQFNDSALVSSTSYTTTVVYTTAMGFVQLPEVTLPQVPEITNAGSVTSYNFRVSSAGATFSDLALLDVEGQTCILDTGAGTASDSFTAAFITEPMPTTGVGLPYIGDSATPETARSAIQFADALERFELDPGSNRLLVLSRQGAPSVTVTYYDRWLTERT